MKGYSELTEVEKKAIWNALDAFIENTSQKKAIYAEAIATLAYYRLQRHPVWRRNPTKTQKNASYKRWKGICQYPPCKDKTPIDPKKKNLHYHHRSRGIPDQHGPDNMVPYHRHPCHTNEHKPKKKNNQSRSARGSGLGGARSS